MSAKRKSRQKNSIINYTNIVDINDYQKKSQIKLSPKNENQKLFINYLSDNNTDIVFGVGPAGSGKTFISVLSAIKHLKDGLVDRIIITRPAVALEEDLGFLPGTLEQKMTPWTMPIFDILKEYYCASSIEKMLRESVIEISPLAYMGGRNFNNAFIIADEMQLSTIRQQKMLLTRISTGSKMVITGDFAQSSKRTNGLIDFVNKLKQHNSSRIALVEFTHKDIERHPAVKEVLELYNQFPEQMD
ncbi:MAG: PhoH family protein [Candidatus Woesearchaeota archaeon]